MTGALTLLRAYADSLYGVEQQRQPTEEADEQTEESSSSGSSSSRHSATRGRFSLVSVGGVEGLAFIACNHAALSPADIVLALLADLRRSAPLKPVPKHLLRILPVLHTASAASVSELLSSLPALLPSLHALPAPPAEVSFRLLFRHSNASGADKRGWIDALAGRVVDEGRQTGLDFVVKLAGSDVVVLCWLVKSVVMIGLLPEYERWRQYHVQQQQQQQPATAQIETK